MSAPNRCNLSEKEKDEYESSMREIQAQCARLWLEIEGLAGKYQPTSVDNSLRGNDSKRAAFLLQKRSLLQTEIERMRKDGISAGPHSPGIILEKALGSISYENTSLSSAIEYCESWIVRLQNEIDWESARQGEHGEIGNELERRVTISANRLGLEEVMGIEAPFEARCKEKEQILSLRFAFLEFFLNRFYPRPSSHGGDKWMSLGEMLNVLISARIDHLENENENENEKNEDVPPLFVSIGRQNFWPPYVELLLRCGIAIVSSDNSSIAIDALYDDEEGME